MRYIVQNLKFKVQNKGFTLIELLVVITIMGILMGILLVSYQGARVSARDGKRKADLEQIRSALQMYHSDCGVYPAGLDFSGSGSLVGQEDACDGNNYMTQIPQDPLPSIYTYYYKFESAHAYTLSAHLEGGGGVDSNCTGVFGSCGVETPCNYKVCQP